MPTKTSKLTPSPQQMVPKSVVSISVEEVALQLFIKRYMDTSGKTVEYMARHSFEVAEQFIAIAREHLDSPIA